MSMRIWHQSFTVLGDAPTYLEALRERISRVVRPDTEVTLHGQIPGTYSSDYPGSDIAHSFLFWVHSIQWIAAARAAQEQGYDAVVFATASNPLVQEIRTVVDIPVIGYGETAMHLSGMYGRRFGLLFFIAGREDFWPEKLRQWGVFERFAGIAHAGVTFHDVVAGFSDPKKRETVVQSIVESGEKLARTSGADVIVPCEMPLNLLLAMAGVSKIGGASVIDGIATAFKMAETLVDLKRVAGMGPSERGFFHAPPNRARVEQVLSFYGLDRLGDRIRES